MIGLDTNVVVRYLAQDDRVQSAPASRIIEHGPTEKNPAFVSIVVMAEAAWLLERAYGMSPRATAAAVERLLGADGLFIEHEQEVFEAAIALKEGRGSFADALIGALGVKAGCSHTLTFDRKASLLPGFAIIRA